MGNRALLAIGVAAVLTALVAFGSGDRALADSARFSDVPDGHMFGPAIEWMADQGITRGCNPPVNDRFCPDGVVTRGQMAAFLTRLMFYRDGAGSDRFSDDDGSIFQADIERLAEAGVTRGCNPPDNTRFCPDSPVTRGQMAAFLVRALALTDDGGGNTFVDDDGSVFETDVAKLAAEGITKGCNPPANDRFCPDSYVTRGQMATFMWRALGQPVVGSPGVNRFDPEVTFVPGAATVDAVSVGSDGGDVVTFESGAPLPRVGEIVAMSPTGAYPNGILGRVVSRAAGGSGGTVVVTEPVALQEAMPEVEFAFEGEVGDVTLSAPQGGSAGSDAFPTSAFERDCDTPGVEVSADLDFSTPDWTVIFSWGIGQPTYGYLASNFYLDSGVNLSFPAGGVECEIEYEPFSISLGTIPGPGGFPLDLDFEVEIEFIASMDAGFGVNLERQDFFSVGATYRDGQFKRIWDTAGRNTSGPSIVKPTLGGSLEFFPGALLEASYRDRVGAEIKAGPSLALDADILADPWWTLTAAPKAALDIEWDLFFTKGDYTAVSLTCCKVVLGKATGPHPSAGSVPPGTIRGTVTYAGSGLPVADGIVEVSDSEGQVGIGGDDTAADGTYEVAGLDTNATYTVSVYPYPGSGTTVYLPSDRGVTLDFVVTPGG